MKLKVARLSDNGKATLGVVSVDGKFQCFSLEDENRDVKVKAETRIPEGTYEVKFRTEGTHHESYKKKYGANHYGMLHVIDVPNFQFILIHIGNTEGDTAGCLLVGESANSNHTVSASTVAYEKLYKVVAAELLKGNKVFIEYINVQTSVM